MKTSPYVRIKEKNKRINELESQLGQIEVILDCNSDFPSILDALVESLQWKGSYMAAMSENDAMRVKVGATVQEQVDKLTFKLQLENKQLQLKVDNLQKIIDTKTDDIQKTKIKIQGSQKGFWDFMYKVFKV